MDNDVFQELNNMSYDDKMLYAYLNKPSKFYWYKKAFAKYNVNGIQKFAWNWSWYAFFFTFLYLLYRKVYKISGALLVFYTIFGSIFSVLSIIFNVIFGGYLPYCVYKRYIKKREEIEKHISDEKFRIEAITLAGGTNQIIVYFTIIFIIIFLSVISLYILSIISIIKMGF